MSVYKRNGSPFWYFCYEIQGKRLEGSTKTTSKTEAKKFAESIKTDFLRGKHEIKVVKKTPFESLVNKFLQWSKSHRKSSTYKRDVVLTDHLLEFFGKKDISDISNLDVEAYQNHREQLVSKSTVNREVSCLGRMYNLAIRWKKADKNPVEDVDFFEEPKKKFRWFPDDEIEQFLKSCSSRMKSIFLVGINTGMRISELLNLKWSQVDFDNNYITIEESKTGEYRDVRMNPVVISVLKGLKRNSEYVFSNHDGKPLQRINKAFKGVCKRAGLKPATPHAMRHTCASHMVKRGIDLYTVMEVCGWKSLEMVLRYSHLAPDHKQMAVNKLAEMECMKKFLNYS